MVAVFSCNNDPLLFVPQVYNDSGGLLLTLTSSADEKHRMDWEDDDKILLDLTSFLEATASTDEHDIRRYPDVTPCRNIVDECYVDNESISSVVRLG